jgi:transcriptional regulator
MLYTPAHFELRERLIAAELVRENPFATLLAPGGDEPAISHVPLLLADGPEPWRLLGHVAQANPQWRLWQQSPRVVAIFHGGDAYISPSLYGTEKAVPTWNYAVVHAHGTATLLHDSAAKERVLKALIDRHDEPYHGQWDRLDLAYREGMKNGIVALDIVVDRIEAKFKLSQNRPADDRERVHAAMQSGSDKERALAGWSDRVAKRGERQRAAGDAP